MSNYASVTFLTTLAVCVLLVGCRASMPAASTSDATAGMTAGAAATSATLPVLSLRDGAFTAEQADRGRRTFNRYCIECHQPQSFVEPGFMDAWAGQPVKGLFELVRATMPESSPGSLSNNQYADVLTYLFQLNGLPAGSVEMPNESQALDVIRIERLARN